MHNTSNSIDVQALSGQDMFVGTNNVWLYSDTCRPVPLFDVPQWLRELVA